MVQALRITQWVIGNFPNSKPICNIRATMSSVASLADEHTIFSQMVAFSDRDWQLEQYLDTMKEAGLSEAFLPMLQGEGDGRLHAHAVAIGVLAKPTAKLGRRGQRRRAGAALDVDQVKKKSAAARSNARAGCGAAASRARNSQNER